MSISTVHGRTAKPSRPDREAQRLATRERLLEVSVAQFQRRSFAETEVAAIVEAAGVSRGTFYLHFPTRGDVLAEVRLREERRIFQEVSPLLTDAAPPATILSAVVTGILQAEQSLGTDILREMCAAQFRPDLVNADSFDEHPLAQLVFAAIENSWSSPPAGEVAQRMGDGVPSAPARRAVRRGRRDGRVRHVRDAW